MVATKSGLLLSTVVPRVPPSPSDQFDDPPPAQAMPSAGEEDSSAGQARRDAQRDRLARLTATAASAPASPAGAAAFNDLATQLRPAFAAFYREKCRGRDDLVEDLSQRAQLGLWQAIAQGRYDPARSAVTTFAYAISHKVWLQHLRASGRRDAALDRYTQLVALGQPQAGSSDRENVGDQAAHASLLEAMRAALGSDASPASLTDDERWLLRSWAGGRSDRDLAKSMGIAASNVNVRKQKAYAKLRDYLAKLGFDRGGTSQRGPRDGRSASRSDSGE